MATGFTRKKASSILQAAIANSYVALSTTQPNDDGSNFNEPATGTGYQRQSIGALDTSIDGQVANKSIIFLFEATQNIGSVTHVGLSAAAGRGQEIFLMAQLNEPLTINQGYVPLIRAHGFVVGLDVPALSDY